MMKNNYDFVVTDIDFVLFRVTNSQWKLCNIENKNYYTLVFVTNGNAIYEVSGENIRVEKGDVVFFHKGKLHSVKSDKKNPWSFYSVAFDISNMENKDIIPMLTRIKQFGQYDEFFRMINSEWTAKKTGSLIKCRSLIMDILYNLIQEVEIKRPDELHYAKIEKVKGFLIENYRKTFTVSELSAIAGLSSSYFRMIFKKNTAMTVIQYQNKVKISKACDLLLSESCNVTEAAYSVGYNDIYYFSRVFKKIKGMSPSEYIKHH